MLRRYGPGHISICLTIVVAGLITARAAVAGGGDAMGVDAREPDTTITLRTTGSAMEFAPSRLAVKHGTNVRLRYVNDGTLPHNFVLMWDVNDIDMLGMAAYDASATGYVPLEFEDKMIAYSDLVVPGDTAEIDFVVPNPGEYTYVCLYAGHYNMMIGTLRSLR